MRITENQALKWDLCRFFAIAQNDKISCHTERSEVSINLKRGYFANAQYDKVCLLVIASLAKVRRGNP